VVDELKKQGNVTVHLINPEHYHLPFPGANHTAEGRKRLQQEVSNVTAVILANAGVPWQLQQRDEAGD
jgi:hypothetical protein